MQNQTSVLTVEEVVRRRKKRRKVQAGFYLVLLGFIAWSIKSTVINDTDWDRIGSPADIGKAISRFIGIDFSLIPNLLGPTIETCMIACIGTLLGLVICIPVIWFGALNITPSKSVAHPLARAAMILSRSIHEIVWALIFVSAVGLGAFAGILAIAARSLGFIAKMLAEAAENIDYKPVEAIRAVEAMVFR